MLDLGSGAGGVGIAAKLAGAAHVTANDIDDCALVANAINARANGVSLESYEMYAHGLAEASVRSRALLSVQASTHPLPAFHVPFLAQSFAIWVQPLFMTRILRRKR